MKGNKIIKKIKTDNKKFKKTKTGLDIVYSVEEMIKNEYPQMKKADARALAILLAKICFTDEI